MVKVQDILVSLENIQSVSKSSGHIPPEPLILNDYFTKFIDFINNPIKEQYQLLMVAIAHHRFEYIHPFDNGNGRMGRLLNYVFLIKLGFQVKNGRIVNPHQYFILTEINTMICYLVQTH